MVFVSSITSWITGLTSGNLLKYSRKQWYYCVHGDVRGNSSSLEMPTIKNFYHGKCICGGIVKKLLRTLILHFNHLVVVVGFVLGRVGSRWLPVVRHLQGCLLDVFVII